MRQQTFVNHKPTLYLVATPIGNMKEFTPRAIEILNNVALIGCEDTRTSKVLLDYFEIKTPVASYHKFNEKEVVNNFINVLKDNKDIALISDAGYPLVSDPGSVLVKEAIDNGFNVTTVSGSSAFLNALVASSFSLSRFTFIGFLDSKSSGRKKELKELKDNKETLIFYESPHRIKETLQDLLLIFGNRRIVLARELTKKFEEYIRGDIKEVLNELEGVKGEIVLIVEGNKQEKIELSESQVEEKIEELKKQKLSKKEIVSIICDQYDLKKNYVYDLVCKDKQ
jgi:16S rRNA (cytidine1402-2'-O)-methyltransferase